MDSDRQMEMEMKTVNQAEARAAFAKRFHEELDRVSYPRSGRGTILAKDTGVTHTASNAWLRGSMPAISKLVEICDLLKLDFTYLCTGRRVDQENLIDADVFSEAVATVNQYIEENEMLSEVGMQRLGILYMRAYLQLMQGSTKDLLYRDIDLAAGRLA